MHDSSDACPPPHVSRAAGSQPTPAADVRLPVVCDAIWDAIAHSSGRQQPVSGHNPPMSYPPPPSCCRRRRRLVFSRADFNQTLDGARTWYFWRATDSGSWTVWSWTDTQTSWAGRGFWPRGLCPPIAAATSFPANICWSYVADDCDFKARAVTCRS